MMRLRFNVLSIDFVRVTNCFYDYDYDYFFRAVTEEIQFTQALSLNWRFTRQSYSVYLTWTAVYRGGQSASDLLVIMTEFALMYKPNATYYARPTLAKRQVGNRVA